MSEASEQYAVAALLYRLLTGRHYRPFSLEREALLREVVELPPLTFRDHGVLGWRSTEEVIGRGLAKLPGERFPTMEDFSKAFHEANRTDLENRSLAPEAPVPLILTPLCSRVLQDLGQVESLDLRLPSPTASVAYGGAGIAWALFQRSCLKGDGEALALAHLWILRALDDVDQAGAFHNETLEPRGASFGPSSLYFHRAGVDLVAALVAGAMEDKAASARALESLRVEARRAPKDFDLCLGRVGLLLGASLLSEFLGPSKRVRDLGGGLLDAIWSEEIPRSLPVGMGHGQAGLLYASMRWCRVSGRPLPSGFEDELDRIASWASRVGGALRWPGSPPATAHNSTSRYLPWWCAGSAGLVHLFTFAAESLGESRYLDLAVGAARFTFDKPSPTADLCCGLAGGAYALLNLHRSTGDPEWLERSRILASKAARKAREDPWRLALYKGALGVALLLEALEEPETCRMPFFEELPDAYRPTGQLVLPEEPQGPQSIEVGREI